MQAMAASPARCAAAGAAARPSSLRAASSLLAAARRPSSTSAPRRAQQQRVHAAAAGGAADAADSASDAATPAGLQAVQELDALIDVLMSKRSPAELAQAVAENIMSFDQRFWLRLATRSDSTAEEEEKAALAALAKVVMQLVDGMVQRTNEQLTESTGLLQEILKAAADPRTGEWELPLPQDKLDAMRAVMAANRAALDEGLLASCYSWLRKAAEDKMDGMVALLQKVLQLYAQTQLGGPAAVTAAASGSSDGSPAEALLSELLAADEALWGRVIRQRASESGGVSEPGFMEALQRRMEAVVLGLPSGSYAQRVQAEYLKELEERAREVFAEAAKAQ